MGVRGLTNILRPLASRSELRGRVVIDGPAFAYHIVHLARVEIGVSTPLEEPTYAVLGSTALRWLDDLQSRGVQVYVPFLWPQAILSCVHSSPLSLNNIY